MNTSQEIGKNSLGMAIGNVSSVRTRLIQNDDNFREAEMLYALKSMLMELDQYFGGGYFSADLINEKCGIITMLASNIHRVNYSESAGGE